MSKVISFRLSKENPREAKAYEVLMTWQGRGYSIRQTIAEALLKLDDCELDSVTGSEMREINEKLSQVWQFIEQLQRGGDLSDSDDDEDAFSSHLADNFIASIKKSAKPGRRLN